MYTHTGIFRLLIIWCLLCRFLILIRSVRYHILIPIWSNLLTCLKYEFQIRFTHFSVLNRRVKCTILTACSDHEYVDKGNTLICATSTRRNRAYSVLRNLDPGLELERAPWSARSGDSLGESGGICDGRRLVEEYVAHVSRFDAMTLGWGKRISRCSTLFCALYLVSYESLVLFM